MNNQNKNSIKSKVLESSRAPVKLVEEVVGETAGLLQDSGELTFGIGLISGVFALTLGFLSFLGVIAFHYPEYLTTPELRHQYSVDVLREILFVSLIVAGGIALANIILNKS